MFFILSALLDKETVDEIENEIVEAEVAVKQEDKMEENAEDAETTKEVEGDDTKTEVKEDNPEDIFKPNKDELFKVIKFLIAADCDVNKQVYLYSKHFYHLSFKVSNF